MVKLLPRFTLLYSYTYLLYRAYAYVLWMLATQSGVTRVVVKRPWRARRLGMFLPIYLFEVSSVLFLVGLFCHPIMDLLAWVANGWFRVLYHFDSPCLQSIALNACHQNRSGKRGIY